ncbi:hypothetical protein B0T10DRAFT_262835 [Thelonectria olida]|uniref:Uncharacterized protein n=1 Tax=Thelonectria olida TaxID=1576542 RepID=A0A9P9AUM4_9HYPO|nr:hypothetical protein B0T10DRAFT_262835 [Thelonectria olida]
MPSNYEKLGRPTGPSIDTVAIPEKCAVSHLSPLDANTRPSAASTPCSDRGNPFDTDVEAMVPSKTTDTCSNRIAQQVSKSECQVWPGKEQWRQKAKLAKKQRGCTCMNRLSRRNKIIAKVLIVFLVVGIAVGVGFGISKPLGAHIWGDNNK